MTQRRFPPPWRLIERDECFIIQDGNGQPLAHVYFGEGETRREIIQRITKDEGSKDSKRHRPAV